MLSITPGLTGNVITSVKQSLLENKKEPENKRMSPVQNYRFTFMNLGPTLSSQCGTSLHTSVFYNAIYASSSTYPIIQNSTQTGEDELLHLLLCFLISLISIHCAVMTLSKGHHSFLHLHWDAYITRCSAKGHKTLTHCAQPAGLKVTHNNH